MKARRTFALLLFALTLPTAVAANDIYDFFKAYLRGTAKEFPASKKKLTSKEVQQNTVDVWKSWRKALRRVEPDTLMCMTRDSLTFAGKWRLPPDLENDATMNFTLFSKGSRPATGYPFFIYLHGSGPRAQEYATGLKLTREFGDAPSVYFVPQIPNEGGYYRWWQKGKIWAWKKLLRKMLANGDINPDKIYFTGISEGAYGTQRLTSYFADYLAGGGAMAGGEPLKNAPAENCANTAFSLLTGEYDSGFYRNTLTKYAAEAFGNLAASRDPADSLYQHNIALVPGRGHSIDYTTTTPWLAAHTRNPYPKYVAWEDFELDGCSRTGFYNLKVVEQPAKAPGARLYYEERIAGDTIFLNISNVAYTTVDKDSLWGIELRFKRDYTPATGGKITIYLNRALADLSHRLTVVVNGKTAFSGHVADNLATMVNSCATFGDPRRIYTAQIDVIPN